LRQAGGTSAILALKATEKEKRGMHYKNKDKTLLILDIDETLIFASDKELDRKADIEMFNYFIYKRPYLTEFIDLVKDDFILAIWSSASDDYVKEIVKHIIPLEIDMAFVWGRSHCTYKSNLEMGDYGYYVDNGTHHYHYVKPLKKLKNKGYMLERMLIVDDTPHKSKLNYGNAIYPKEFLGDSNDNELLILASYLKTLKDKDNVRKLEKRGWQKHIM
jgi:RNA polymerase II subunit A small phosphatase-like protein